ncbi:MAG: ATP-dependent helicase RhlB, partial [Gammaproteobacteria bacterium]|nr:ATP-dependent helicase RhlB [Gammaproteobacteria bacterium]
AGQAQTGTGKTAAFLVALFNRLLTDPGAPNRPVNAPRAIVIAPTRELAVQIHSDAVGIGKYTGLKLAIVFGGVDYEKQRRILEEGVDVLIGTPGRIIDYFKQHVFDLRHIQVAVMDEADRMFDLGFIKDIRFILRRLPHPELRLTMMFSATLSHRVMELAYEHMNNPELIRIEPDKMTVDRVKQVLYFPATEEKIPLLMGLLRRIGALRTMVFVNTKRMAEVLERTLTANGFVAQALSGDVPQNKRLKMMRDFHSGDIAVLIATDVASRGLHIPDVSHVFNFDLPNDAEDYVHRIGRTARAGADGDAISFGCEEYAISLPDIEQYIGHQIPRASIEAVDLAEVTAPPPAVWRERAPRPGQSRGGGRPGGGRSGGPSRSGGGGGRHAGGPRRAPSHGGGTHHGGGAPIAGASPPAPSNSEPQASGQPQDPARKRRRRRRGGGGGGPAGGTPNPGAAGPAL